MRPLANQMLYFLAQGLEEYLAQNQLNYVKEEGKFMTPSEYRQWEQAKRFASHQTSDEAPESDIPF